MPGDLVVLGTLLRECLSERTLPREPEPDLVMSDPEQVDAYALAGRIDGVMSASYLFHTARISQVIQGSATVLDLGCGPATQLAQVAQVNPDTRFVGVDLSDGMLGDAQRHVSTLGLSNVSFQQDDISKLSKVADQSVDAVMSTMALHHLPTWDLLDGCFAQIRRVLKPGGAVYLTDFGRLKSLRSVISMAYINAKHQPHLFSLDYERSLRAAFERDDFAKAATRHLPSDVTLWSTFAVPFLVILKTADRGLSEGVKSRLASLRSGLPRRYVRDLDNMRMFFRLGGMKNDPF